MGFPAGQREGHQIEFQLFWGRGDGLPCRTAGRAPNRISAVLGKRRWASLPDSGKGTKSNFGCFGGEPMGFPARQRERRGVKFRSFWGRTCAIPRLTAGKDPRKRFSRMPILRQRVSPPAGQTFPALRAPVGQGQQKGGPRAALLLSLSDRRAERRKRLPGRWGNALPQNRHPGKPLARVLSRRQAGNRTGPPPKRPKFDPAPFPLSGRESHRLSPKTAEIRLGTLPAVRQGSPSPLPQNS